MPLIVSKPPPGKIRYAVEKLIGDRRMLQIRREHADTQTVSDEWREMEHCDRPMMVVLNPLGDIDESMLKDIIQSVVGRKYRRHNKPNVTLLYHQMNEMRAMEFRGKQF